MDSRRFQIQKFACLRLLGVNTMPLTNWISLVQDVRNIRPKIYIKLAAEAANEVMDNGPYKLYTSGAYRKWPWSVSRTFHC